jgi:hypothetical protein
MSQLSASCNNKRYGIQELEGYVHGFNNQMKNGRAKREKVIIHTQ